MVEMAFPSNRLFTKTNVLRFRPAALPSAISAQPAPRLGVFFPDAVVRLKSLHCLAWQLCENRFLRLDLPERSPTLDGINLDHEHAIHAYCLLVALLW
jgi:hypothetical protein